MHIIECLTYTNLTDGDRKVTTITNSDLCDSSLARGWYRFQGDAGTKMPTTCPQTNSCATDAPSWLNGAHPTVGEGKVNRQVCFHWSSNCCNWSINIQVRNCGPYFIYYLSQAPACDLRYCSTD